MAHIDSGGDPNSIKAGRELADVAIPPLFHQALYLVIVCVAVWFAMAGLLKFAVSRMADGDAPVSALARPGGQLPPEPRLLTDEPTVLREFRAGEAARLHEYGWVDQAAGTVHIPIDRAMDLLLERGIAARAGSEDTPAPVRPPVVDRDDRPTYGGGH